LPKATPPKKRRNKPILSIRARLIVVALLAIAPLMVERVRGLERARVERAAVARSQVIDLARSGVAAQREVVDSTRALLRVAARVYTKMPFDARSAIRSSATCRATFGGCACWRSPETTAR
jgi:hypothetical protein